MLEQLVKIPPMQSVHPGGYGEDGGRFVLWDFLSLIFPLNLNPLFLFWLTPDWASIALVSPPQTSPPFNELVGILLGDCGFEGLAGRK